MRLCHRRTLGMGCKGEALDGGRGGVPHNFVPPSPGEEKGARGMRSAAWGIHVDGFESPPWPPNELPNGGLAMLIHGH